MKTFKVLIEATIRKEIEVEAENRDEAVEQAHELFTTENDGTAERYEEDMISVEEVKRLEEFSNEEDGDE